jgi:hypothetical protein
MGGTSPDAVIAESQADSSRGLVGTPGASRPIHNTGVANEWLAAERRGCTAYIGDVVEHRGRLDLTPQSMARLADHGYGADLVADAIRTLIRTKRAILGQAHHTLILVSRK